MAIVDKLTVRLYNVGFGDCILITVPDRSPGGLTTQRHILVDFGNLPGSGEAVFDPIASDILATLANKPLDLFIMTHEHLDHVRGMLFASQKLNKPIPVNYTWLTASSADNYYETHPKAHQQKVALINLYEGLVRYLGARSGLSPAVEKVNNRLQMLLNNNDPGHTADCVGYLKTIAKNAPPSFISRGVIGQHPFEEAGFEIWGPEEDTSSYFGRKQPLPLAAGQADDASSAATLPDPQPLPGVDAGAFYDLLDFRRRGSGDAMLSIDAASNNTSVVFMLTWRGWRLLFTGDAEGRSWTIMDQQQQLKPVHFLKISHHLSPSGTPADELLNKILPTVKPDHRLRSGAICTCPNIYPGVPDEISRKRISQRLDRLEVIGGSDQTPLFVELEFPDLSQG